MRKVRWGVLSTAQIAREFLLPALARAENAEIGAIASANPAVDQIAEKFGIPTIHRSYEELLEDDQIDVVYIPLPNALHAEWVKKAAKKGKHVLCEKPAALTAKEAKEMLTVCIKNNVLFLEGFMYRFHPQHQRVREIIESGEIGEVKAMRVSLSFTLDDQADNIRTNPALGGGSLYDVGCYCIHAIRNLTRSEPMRVAASRSMHPVHKVDSTMTGMMEMENGVTALFDAAMDRMKTDKYELIGTNGMIEVERAFTPHLFAGEGVITVTNEKGEKRNESLTDDQYKLEAEWMSARILSNAPSADLMEDALNNLIVMDACRQSAKGGTFVSVSPEKPISEKR
ncbi:Gfo/Idh/MocA family protein [Domibacillus enclensis]|uniref:Oxidoreductase n=1 Tax=Domibacillus enclensis TaxID=1017273 RepID=A0A1N7ARH4_9BACI|nr:Gfo/Idh/MocA family oxidoreductase [Domibacillus enclensis]OXS75058.1 oxidoreductase [Domibacillus enclensis]SIR41757.1 Predicted dehydrogenase [Domibacillus enclensis]